jgi:hypothetical protein
MELMLAQVRKIDVVSDTVLYPEATALVKQLIEDEECNPLPSSQITGLLSVAGTNTYTELYRFVLHQRDRNWTASKMDIKKFYTALEKYLSDMARQRVKAEFHLIPEGLDVKQTKQMTEVVMAVLAQNFIQHFVAENNRRAAYVSRRR